MTDRKSLCIAYTPDSDDAFYYDALETGRVILPGYEVQLTRAPLSALNREALAGRYDVTAISSVVYPQVADRYAILGVGTSVGRGYGPVLVSKRFRSVEELAGRWVGVGGIPTTGWFLLQVFCPGAVAVELAYDRIGEAIAVGDLDAGVMIHEELLYYPMLGLHRVLDLGAAWGEQQGLPLPVGLNVIRRDLGRDLIHRVAATLRRSLRCALDQPAPALARVSRFGRGARGGVTEQFVSMFANDDSLRIAPDVRAGLEVLFKQAVDLGLGDTVPTIDIIEATAAVAALPESEDI
jgi:1,4-dihydroxy-6-naphthoate synthase